jgi:hypothetical protein
MTERDRHLCAVMAHARWLTTPQLKRLAFPGRHQRDFLRRLQQLSTALPGAPALLQKHVWVTRDGLKHVWGLTPAGYVEAGLLLDEELEPPPVDFEPETMAHHVALTELYVGVLAAPLDAALKKIPPRLSPLLRKKALSGLYARAFHRAWRWTVVGDGVTLPWKIYEDGRTKDKVLRPDAVLELVEPRRRVFIEAETGTHTVVPRHADNKPNSTMSKLDRWETYVSGLGDVEGRRSWYQLRYPDGYAPEVLFLVHSEKRAKTVNDAIGQWHRKHPSAELDARALTLPQVLEELGVAPAEGARSERISNGAFSSREKSGTGGSAGRIVLSEAEADVVVQFMTAFHSDFKRRQGRPVGAPAEAVVKPEPYEPMKALARRLLALRKTHPA